ncbi:MAG TPA: D-alanyl-D-alanine carboxypeptidase/D-alanyl-D-alanine-endopeptidase [Baekduia sp.]|nr:D-alanyl-D-alanine carboxypeptidase/D-alanyl-D-alanine-endopeptidase [Baekduia sp.]
MPGGRPHGWRRSGPTFLLRFASTRRLVAITAVALCAPGLAPAGAAAISQATLSSRLSALHGKLGGSNSVLVADLTSRDILFQRSPTRALAPASNEKLFVTSAALLKFGTKGRLATNVLPAAGREIDEEGVLRGNLYLVGGGDPSFGNDAVGRLANQLDDAGLKKITGAVVGDESAFDKLRGGPDSGYRYDYYLGGSLSALSWGHGASLSGSPALAAATRLAGALKSRGIKYARKPRAGIMPAVAAGTGGTGAGAAALATVTSPTMAELAAATNIPSENFYAEMLTKALGAYYGKAGSTKAGLAVVNSALSPFSISPTLVDGSGLSRSNRTSARTLVTLLAGMDKSAAGPAFRASLPVAGLSGTLRKRMRGTPAAGRCRAKTGTLNGVSSLSGFCFNASGRRIAFAVIANGVSTYSAKKIEDRMVSQIARLD